MSKDCYLQSNIICLRETQSRHNAEKTFYCLLMRYREKRLENYRSHCPSQTVPRENSSEVMSSIENTRKPINRNSLNKPFVKFPRAGINSQIQAPIRATPTQSIGGTVSQKKALLERNINSTLQQTTYPPPPKKLQQRPKLAEKILLSPITDTAFSTPSIAPLEMVDSTGKPRVKTQQTLSKDSLSKPTASTSPTKKMTVNQRIIAPSPKELSPNKPGVTTQFASEIEKAFK